MKRAALAELRTLVRIMDEDRAKLGTGAWIQHYATVPHRVWPRLSKLVRKLLREREA